MLRFLTILFAFSLATQAGLLPEEFGGYRRAAVYPGSVSDRPVMEEFGLDLAESAEYTGPSGEKFVLTAYRLEDPTGAFAAFQYMRPADAESGATSARTPNGSLVQRDNYLLHFEGGRPHPASLAALYGKLPNRRSSSLPALTDYLPRKGRVPNSERYLLGPVSLARVEPRIGSDLAQFSKGAEAQVALYQADGREVQLTIVSYPTPQMAMERHRAFQSLAGAVVRRTGPMLLVVPEGAGSPVVEKLLEGINYKARATWNEQPPAPTVQDAAEMILAISALALGLIVLSVLLGMFFGGSKFFLARFGIKGASHELTTLHLGDK